MNIPNTIEEFKKILHENVCKIRFTKKDGTEREMLCTTQPLYFEIFETMRAELPAVESSENQTNLVRVYSLKDFGWRSVLFESLLEIKIIDTNVSE